MDCGAIAYRPLELDGCFKEWNETFVENVLRTEFADGSLRSRRRFTGRARIIKASVTLPADKYDAFIDWYQVNQRQGILPTRVIDPKGREQVVQWTAPPVIDWLDKNAFRATVEMYQHSCHTMYVDGSGGGGGTIVIPPTVSPGPTPYPNGIVLEVNQPMDPIDIESMFDSQPAPTVVALDPLPAGLDLTNGILSGTPTQDGMESISFRAFNEAGEATVGPFTLMILAGPPEAPRFSGVMTTIYGRANQALPNFDLSQQFTGSPPPFYEIEGVLPAGVMLDSATGILSGMPTFPGTYRDLRIRAYNGQGADWSTPFDLVIREAASAPGFRGPDIGPLYLKVGTAITDLDINHLFTANPAPTFSIASGTLPAGLSLSADGVLSGTPTDAGPGAFSIRATNTMGHTDSNMIGFTPVVEPTWTGQPTNLNLQVGVAMTPVDLSQLVDGAPAPEFIVVGNLPWGLHLDRRTGLLSGWPVEAGGAPGLKIQAINAYGSEESAEFDITVVP